MCEFFKKNITFLLQTIVQQACQDGTMAWNVDLWSEAPRTNYYQTVHADSVLYIVTLTTGKHDK